MKAALFGLLVLASADQGSLGVGLDVLPEAYTFAARRLNVFPDLRLSSCDRTSCRWRVGNGVEMTAYVSGRDLSINRLEAGSAVHSPLPEDNDPAWFQKACEGIVALVLPGEGAPEVRSIADQIATTSNQRRSVEIRRGGRGVRFYGARVAAGGNESQRCGAVAEAL